MHMCHGKLKILKRMVERNLLLPVHDDFYSPGYIPDVLEAVEKEDIIGPPVITFNGL